MKIKSTISSKIIDQKQTLEGYETIMEVGFMAGGGVVKQKIFIFQSNEDLTAGIFKPLIREVQDE